ncbi:MAG: ribonuclease H family protein [Gemella haemolysans]|uniref:ribonuclease H family protein n=1 Tax=Gemella haemolysans TaxID=1379 RepID=UPI0029098AF0|nr:ribonuclease H family protein [Gemella haemolysans]MDU6573441.1 ribonuclease H family protein [Gemella haemolysans]
MTKFYAVKKGKKTGIFSTWDECKEQVTGFKGAVYKSFKTLSEAEAFLERNEEKIENIEEVDGVYAYIDGSFDRVSGIYGSGVVIVDGDKKHEYKHAGNREDYAQLHNVAGELEAAKFVMWYAVDKKIKEITLFYDYQGIEAWAVGDWKANLPYTQDYVKFYNKVKTAVKVNFVKVKAHTGIELNEVVDKLAKEAIEQFKKENSK